LAKESIALPDLVRILGDRPFPLKETIREYLEELRERNTKTEEEAKAANTPTDEANKSESSTEDSSSPS